MKLLRTIKEYPEFKNGVVGSIGNFDGVHLGHQSLLDILRKKADNLHLPMLVIIFEPQAREFFLQKKAPPRLSRFREKIQLLKKSGVEYVLCLRFNQKLANMQSVDFAKHVIFLGLNIKYLLVGEDFKFGHDRLGDFALLEKLGIKLNCKVEKFPDYLLNFERVSSTKVRQALQLSNFNKVQELLGRKYSITGKVIYGAANGRKWGVPTANIKLNRVQLPLAGVFCVQINIQNSDLLQGVANIGNRPTIDGTKQILEVHIFDFNESLYGEIIEVLFLHKLRDEVKFSSLDALIAQIKQDVQQAREFFQST